jgi:hypothetical protein
VLCVSDATTWLMSLMVVDSVGNPEQLRSRRNITSKGDGRSFSRRGPVLVMDRGSTEAGIP